MCRPGTLSASRVPTAIVQRQPQRGASWRQKIARSLTSLLANLYLDDTKVTDAGLTHLRTLNGLQILMLKNTAVSDAGLDELKDHSRLHMLVLSGIR